MFIPCNSHTRCRLLLFENILYFVSMLHCYIYDMMYTEYEKIHFELILSHREIYSLCIIQGHDKF